MSLSRDTDPVEDVAETEFPRCSVRTYDPLRSYTETVLSTIVKIQTAEYPVALLGEPRRAHTFHFRDLPFGAQPKAALQRAAEPERRLVFLTLGTRWKEPFASPSPSPARLWRQSPLEWRETVVTQVRALASSFQLYDLRGLLGIRGLVGRMLQKIKFYPFNTGF